MTYYMRSGNSFFVTKDANMPVNTHLEAGTYVVNFDPNKGFFLSGINDFDVSGRIYGDVNSRAERVINTFYDRPASTGVILSGEKGSGKTMLTKLLSAKLIEDGVVTIIVNNAFCGTQFNDFIATIEQPALIIFDEFEKVYADGDTQEALLTLFDGIFTTKKLFVITSNNKAALTDYIINRPGRFYYAFNYYGLDREFIAEYATENLKNKEHLEKFKKIVPIAYDPVNFDMLKALVEEMNRYNEDIFEVTKYLNINETKSKHEYIITDYKVKNTPTIPFIRLLEDNMSSNGRRAFAPFSNNWTFYYMGLHTDNDVEEGAVAETYEESTGVTFGPKNITKLTDDVITYENEHFIVSIKRAPPIETNIYAML